MPYPIPESTGEEFGGPTGAYLPRQWWELPETVRQEAYARQQQIQEQLSNIDWRIAQMQGRALPSGLGAVGAGSIDLSSLYGGESASTKKAMDDLLLQRAALQAALDEEQSKYVGVTPETLSADWQAAAAARREYQIQSGVPESQANKEYQTAVRLAAQNNAPSFLLEQGQDVVDEEPEGDDGTGGQTDPRQNDVLVNMSFGLDPQTAVEMSYGSDRTAWPTWAVGLVDRAGGGEMSEGELADIEYKRALTQNALRGNLSGDQFWYDIYSKNPNDPAAMRALGLASEGMTDYQRQMLAAQQQQTAFDNAYRQQALAQQAAYQQAMLEQQRREMAAQIGAQVASMANQSYMDTLGQRLPAGTQYAPGFGPTGAMASLAGMSGLPYQATQIGVANPPTTDELMRTVQDAISRF